MALAGHALVAIWNDILPESRADFFEWHPREHMVERLGIPGCLLYTSPSPRDRQKSRMPSSA